MLASVTGLPLNRLRTGGRAESVSCNLLILASAAGLPSSRFRTDGAVVLLAVSRGHCFASVLGFGVALVPLAVSFVPE